MSKKTQEALIREIRGQVNGLIDGHSQIKRAHVMVYRVAEHSPEYSYLVVELYAYNGFDISEFCHQCSQVASAIDNGRRVAGPCLTGGPHTVEGLYQIKFLVEQVLKNPYTALSDLEVGDALGRFSDGLDRRLLEYGKIVKTSEMYLYVEVKDYLKPVMISKASGKQRGRDVTWYFINDLEGRLARDEERKARKNKQHQQRVDRQAQRLQNAKNANPDLTIWEGPLGTKYVEFVDMNGDKNVLFFNVVELENEIRYSRPQKYEVLSAFFGPSNISSGFSSSSSVYTNDVLEGVYELIATTFTWGDLTPA